MLFLGFDLRPLQFPRLRRLDLAGLDSVMDDGLEALGSALSLTHIDLSRREKMPVVSSQRERPSIQ